MQHPTNLKPESLLEPLTQAVACKSRKLHRRFKDLSSCFACEQKGSGCRFKGNRTINPPDPATATEHISFEYEAGPEPQFPSVFNRQMTAQDALLKMAAAAQILHPILVGERSFLSDRPDIIRRKREVEVRVTCDACRADLFAHSWLCSTCGYEMCATCSDNTSEPNYPSTACYSTGGGARHTLLPVIRFEEEELDEAIRGMELLLEKGTPSQNAPQPCLNVQGNGTPNIPTFRKEDIDISAFQHNLSLGVPAVITNVNIQGYWGPEYFIERYGRHIVTVVDCETDTNGASTVAKFFAQFGVRAKIMKLKDWPPQKDFSTEFPEINEAFVLVSPFPDVTGWNGVLNAASHYPMNGISPDLGPKMYNADGSIQDNTHHGSAKLHLDLTDALNLMVWAANTPSGEPDAAWDIYPPWASGPLRKFIRENCGFTRPDDPIHSQSIYMTPTMNEQFYNKYKIRPYRIYQRPGECVIIPAGCAHQVSNRSASIKIARDYVSLDSLARTEQLVAEFRNQRLTSGGGDDVLQLYTMLWYLWVSLRGRSFPTGDEVTPVCSQDSDTDITSDHPSSILPDPVMDSALLGSSSAVPHPKALRRREKNKASKAAKKLASPDHKFKCEFCPRMFHRGGLIDHLHAKKRIRIDEATDKKLRKPRRVSDADFQESLKPFLIY